MLHVMQQEWSQSYMDSHATNLLQDWLLETNCLLFVSVSGTKNEIHYLAIHQSNRDGRIF